MSDGYDGRIDWRTFYSERVGRPKVSGTTLTGLCPLHDNTRTPAFSANIETGMYKCHGCGAEGNPTTFLAELEGIDTKDAHAKLLELAGVEPKKQSDDAPPYTVAAYCAEKGLDQALVESWGVVARKRGRVSWLEVPYYDEQGTVVSTRKRMAPGSSSRFLWVKGSTLTLYGLWHVPRWITDGVDTVALVEGESDCHALWSLGIPALGVPGASTFKAAWMRSLDGVTLALHDESDDGAAVLREKVATELAGTGTKVTVWSTPGAKDPSDLYSARGADAGTVLVEAMRAAVPLDVPSDGAKGAAVGFLPSLGLLCPEGWHCDERGVFGVSKDDGDVYLATATPVLLTRRIIDAAGGGERVEVSWLRDGRWGSLVADRDAVFSTRTIVGLLAPRGVHITSENARHIVRWLGALEASNLDALPNARSASTFGWCGEAFLPVDPRDVVMDYDESAAELVDAFTPRGTLEQWCAAMAPHRERSHVFRFIVAASLAAPLLRVTRGRIFFVYNWGSSKGGKTAAVKAALSAWGDPEILMTTFNATIVGLERMASLMRDLPLGVDERQMSGGNQERLNQMVYTLASGTGRVRGARDGGLQATTHWRTVVLATGEEPLGGATSQTGVSTRVLELIGSPFDDEGDAADMHVTASEYCGTAGAAFIERLALAEPGRIEAMHTEALGRVKVWSKGHASSHLAGVALVTVADALMSEWLYGMEADDAMVDALMMSGTVLSKLEDAAAGDVDEAAILWLEGWLHSNADRFRDGGYGQRLGERRDGAWLVYPGPMRDAIEAAGFSYRKTMRALDLRGMLPKQGLTGTGAVTYPTVQRVHGANARVLWLEMGDGAVVQEELGARKEPF